MSLDRFKPAWQQLKLNHSFESISHEEVLAVIAQPATTGKYRSLMVNLMMLLTFLMVCY
ncbi:MAG: hypothetical protein HEP71_33005 [Roseivirga sp.]|nr:hypothetical protein [Roseivirga sp.]